MTPRESSTVGLITRHLESRYAALVDKTHGGPMKSGLLDLVCCVRGRYVEIEVKAPGAKRGATPAQRARINRVRRHGGLAFVASSCADVDAALLGEL